MGVSGEAQTAAELPGGQVPLLSEGSTQVMVETGPKTMQQICPPVQHVVWQHSSPAGHTRVTPPVPLEQSGAMHLLSPQKILGSEQAVPHAPQCWGSFFKLTHLLLQQASP